MAVVVCQTLGVWALGARARTAAARGRGGLPSMWNVSVTMVLESRVGRKALGRPDPSDTTVRFMGVYDLILFEKEKGEHEYLSTR